MAKPVGVWIVAVAVGSFAAGLVVGYAAPGVLAAAPPLQGPEQYARNLVDKYGLSAEQHQRLLMVLEDGERRELEILKRANWNQLPPGLRGARLEANRKTEQRIRFVLDERQRALYDRDSRPDGSGPRDAGRPQDR
ncbi:MAG: hypothetical protein ACON4Z_16645 [Planctomycetota bacterium]